MTDAPTLASKNMSLFKRVSTSRRLAYGLAATAVISGIATAATMTGPLAQNYDIGTVVSLLYVDGILLLLLSTVIARRMVLLWRDGERGKAGAGLHGRLVLMFSLVAVTPAILVAVFSALYLNFGLQTWFSERINTAINQSRTVANAYLQEHRNNIRGDALSIANELNFNASRLSANPFALNAILTSHANFRSLSEAVVIDGLGKVLGRSRFSLIGDAVNNVTSAQFTEAETGEIVILRSASDDQVRALMKLNRFVNSYLLVERFIDPRVFRYIDRINEVVGEYNALEKNRDSFQISFVMVFVILALLLLMAAAWVGITVSNQLASPIGRLIRAAEEVSEGDLSVRVETSDDIDEIGTLTHTFNTMTTQLETQRTGLEDAHRALDERHRFTETVLSGVSAGVIGLDASGNIYLPNRSASILLGTDLEETIGRPISDVVPEMTDLFNSAMSKQERQHRTEIQLIRDNETKILHAKIAAEKLEKEIIGYVITFDDVTELLSAQRTAAWADVARRIAHEIKNPLTPIQLSAERLKRKYLAQITDDPDVFATCTETIVRQVEDIGRMVDEFSSFARMPEPAIKSENLSEICRQAVFLEQNRNPDIKFNTILPDQDIEYRCDAQQLSRALTNLLKNAAESINSAIEQEKTKSGQGSIDIEVTGAVNAVESRDEIAAQIIILDNGLGLPTVSKDRLTDPYVTTRTKGTGLGLAIVKKIMEEHGGELNLADRNGQGAEIILTFKRHKDSKTDSSKLDGINPEHEINDDGVDLLSDALNISK
jgi:two-component system nitrogen regulation sensor histidine kinase NtrY